MQNRWKKEIWDRLIHSRSNDTRQKCLVKIQPVSLLKIQTVRTRWSQSGVWQRMFETLAQDADNEYAMIDATIVRAHQHSAGAKGGISTSKPSDEAGAG